jgi:outer membrane protein OmpA-like peptidoglycan-associated protein
MIMANEHTSRRARLSKGWWLLALIAVVLLYFLILFVKSAPIENDNKMPRTEQLSPENVDETTLGTEKKVPEILPIDAPEHESDIGKSIQIAQEIKEDAPMVGNLIEIKPYSAVKLSIQTNARNGIRLSGVMPAQQNIDALYQATVDAFGKDKVINELTVGKRTAASSALDGIANFMSTLKGIKKGTLQIVGNTGSISGEVDSELLKQEVLSQISHFLTGEVKDSMTFSDNLAVDVVKLKNKKIAEQQTLLKREVKELVEINQQREPKKALVATLKLQICQKKLVQIMAGKTILFETNQSNIEASSFTLLGTITNIINECRDNILNTKIDIRGYTDSRGGDTYNLSLSQSRADAVKDYLVQTGHIKHHLIRATGHGKAQPIASNDTKEGRMRNRRITISIQ